MPILPAEPDCFPADLWDSATVREQSERQWWCLHTKPRQEKAIARELRKQAISYYLPMLEHKSRTPNGRAIRSVMPLFPGYVFLLGNHAQRVEAMRGNRVIKVLEAADQLSLDHDLRQIHRLVHSGLAVHPEPEYAVGTTVRILSGPLQGVVGTVVRRQKRDRFVATVRFLGHGARVDLEDWQVERFDEQPAGHSGSEM
jgi:transcriptional antiterminator RfaH